MLLLYSNLPGQVKKWEKHELQFSSDKEVQTLDQSVILCYIPAAAEISLRNSQNNSYAGEWFDPANNKRYPAGVSKDDETGVLTISRDEPGDRILILKKM